MQHNAEIVKKLGVLCMLFLITANFGLMAQNRTDLHWYFGNNSINLQFDKGGRDVFQQNNQATPFGIGGSAVISDPFTGNLIFYTDGLRLYDADHQPVPGGDLISVPGGDFNHSAVASPLPGNTDQFYIFSNTSSEILVSTVDASLQGNALGGNQPLGDVVISEVSSGLTDPSEAMLVLPNDDNTGYWLISQNRNTLVFRVTTIDNTGFAITNDFDLTSAGNPGSVAASFAFNADSSWIAVAPRDANRNVQILNFDVSSGNLSFNRQINNTGFNDGGSQTVFDVAWSNDGSKLYFSRFGSATGNNADLLQFDFADSLENINSVLSSNLFRSFGIKRAPDDRIYHLYQLNAGDPITLARIAEADSIFSEVEYDSVVYDGLDFEAIQFPEFAPSPPIDFTVLDFTVLDSCTTDFTKFVPTIIPSPTTVSWDLGDGNFSSDHSPVNMYGSAGTFNVTLRAQINGQFRSTSRMVQILQNDLMINLGNDTTICPGEILTLDAGMEAVSYLWSTGETSQTIQVDTTGTYWVEGISATGCGTFDEIVVTTYRDPTIFTNQWYFGERAGIEFNTLTDPTVAITDANLMDSPEGCASMSDANGELLFYTNGNTIWNKEHEIMLNGTSIGGDSTSTQAAIAVQAPYETTIYYVFTTQEIEADSSFLSYSIVDMKHDLAKGMVVAKNIPLFFNSTERLIVSDFFNNISVMVHEVNNNSFRNYPVTMTGIGAPLFYPIGTDHSADSEDLSRGYMKFSQDNNLLAVPIQAGTDNFIEIFDYDDATDSLSNPRLIDIDEPAPSRIYGLEFSMDGSQIYYTTSTTVAQFALDSLGTDNEIADIEATKNIIETGTGLGALQLGPDGQMYMAVDGETTIRVNSAPNSDNASFDDFDLQGRTSRLGLPAFTQMQPPNLQEPSINITAGCVGQESMFSATGRDNSIEMYSWDVGVPGLAPFTEQMFNYTYEVPGTYNVVLTLSNRCDVDTVLMETVEIFNAPENPTNPPAIPFCDGPVDVEAFPVDDPTLTFNWSTGETTRVITVNEPSTVSVSITNANGCISDTVTTLVIDARPVLELGNDLTICQNDVVPPLDAQNPGATYTWTIDGVAANTIREQPIDVTVPGTFLYRVTVVDPISFCVTNDSLNITIQEQPNITVSATQSTGCGLNDGAIDLTINSSGNFSYEISGPTSIAPGPIDAPLTVPQFSGLAPGNYTVTVTNNITSCNVSEVIQIEDNATFGVEATAVPDCGSEGDIDLTISNPANFIGTDVMLTIQDANGQFVVDAVRGVTYDGVTDMFPVNPDFITTPFTVFNLDTGNYFITLAGVETGGNLCVVTDTVRLTERSPQPNVTLDNVQSVCGISDPVLVTSNETATLSYAWTVINGPGNIVNIADNEVFVDGDAVLQVIITGPVADFCPRTEIITVDFNDALTGVIEEIGDPCNGFVDLNVNIDNGSGNFSFNWNNGAGSTGLITVNTSNTFVVTVRDQVTGCEITLSQDVVIEDLLEVNIISDPDCDNNGNLLLTAEATRTDVTFAWTDQTGQAIGTTPTVTVGATGTYTVVVTTENGNCQVIEDFSAVIAPIDESLIDISATATFCSRDPANSGVTLDAGAGFDRYEWRRLPDTDIIGANQTLIVTEEGEYEVSLMLGASCVSRTIVVTEDCLPRLELPNAFTPNGTGPLDNNEFFVFPNNFVTDFEIFIYSRWGELIFHSTEQDFRWDGNFRNKPAPVDTYAYIIKFSSNLDADLEEIVQRGTVTLIR